MAKRFTDTNKWDQAWFRKLTPRLKCLWMFMVDRCDHAGVLEIDFDSMSFFVGEIVVIEDIETHFLDQIEIVSDTKIIITAFIDFQYGELNPENRVHKSVISRLERLALKKGLKSTLKGTKDKYKNKDLNNINTNKGDKNFEKEIEKIYSEHYPLKIGKQKGVEKLSREIRSEYDLDQLVIAIARYKSTIKPGTEPKFIKHFSTFATTWREWLDPNAGQADSIAAEKADLSQIQWGKP